ncbi:MAG: hypothetical protein FJ125_14065 [Deltaproteobacteria bacterium]|nr:hypothetical protein [Deltaproteobacteria bacterium]
MSEAQRIPEAADQSAGERLEGELASATIEDDGEELLVDLGQRWTTLSELGNTLPLAVGPDRSFSFRPRSLKLRAEIGERLRPYRQRETATGLATYALAASLATLQGRDVAALKLDDTVALLRQLPWSSVIHLTFRMQIEQAGDDVLPLGPMRCTVCGRPQARATARLGDMRVRAYDRLDHLPELETELYDGLRFAGRTAQVITLRPARWDFLLRLVDLDNPGQVTLAALRSAICRLDAHEGEVTPDEAALGGLSWRDGELLDAEHNLLSGGPTSVLPVQCQGHTWPVLYSWRSAGFFGQPRDPRSRRKPLRSR